MKYEEKNPRIFQVMRKNGNNMKRPISKSGRNEANRKKNIDYSDMLTESNWHRLQTSITHYSYHSHTKIGGSTLTHSGRVSLTTSIEDKSLSTVLDGDNECEKNLVLLLGAPNGAYHGYARSFKLDTKHLWRNSEQIETV